MIKLPFAQNKTYYLVGLGKSNNAVITSLKKSGADILVWDDNPENLIKFDDKIIRSPDKAPWSKIKAVIVAPGVKPNHVACAMAAEKNVPVLCDIDLFAQSKPKTTIIGVTGTNGKSTTTALIHHILNANDKSQMGGNIGVPVLDLKSKCDYTVLELSSYQLERSPNLACDIAILLNITPDHLDWHETMDNYVVAKAKIFTNARHKIISIDDDYSHVIYNAHDDAMALSVMVDDMPVNPMDFPRLKGQHNLQNILAAYMACRAIDMPHEDIIARIKTFDGVPHRQYLVRVINGIPYINDSKATNAEAAKMALRSFRNILWIAGGIPKDGGLNGIEGDLGYIQKAYIYGAAIDEFGKFLRARGIDVTECNDMTAALMTAHKDAQNMRGEPSGSPTVLLSPAAASFDQFKNFEHRGDVFCELVMGLSDE